MARWAGAFVEKSTKLKPSLHHTISTPKSENQPASTLRHWWKEAVIYQIYPRSFNDTNADGIGDLQGIISKLDYLKLLGVDVLWLSPIFASPNTDNGYDIADYEAIMTEFGSMADFDELLAAAHERGLKIILDLVVNHSSDEHYWFKESQKSTQNPYRDYYIWRDSPNDWLSFFSGSAWELSPETNQYYLHLFAKKQPDLNWENPALRQEIYDMMHFWLGKGVDGFRMDVIPFLSKDPAFPDYPAGRYGDLTIHANGPRIHEFLREMNQQVLAHYDCLTVGEGFGVGAHQANLYVGHDRQELNMIYHFDHAVPRDEACFGKPAPEFTLAELKGIFARWDAAVGTSGWQNIYFGNHDNPRVLSRFGGSGTYQTQAAKMLAAVLLTQRGTPCIFQGDELGMTNCPFESVAEFDDIQVKNAYNALVVNGSVEEADFLKAANRIARDHARTPMQWSAAAQAGFTDGSSTWLKVNPNHATINADAQLAAPDSVFHFYRQLLAFRKQTPALIYGDYQDILPDHAQVWAYTRHFEGSTIWVFCNFSETDVVVDLPVQNLKILFGNNPNSQIIDKKLTLSPFEALVLG